MLKYLMILVYTTLSFIQFFQNEIFKTTRNEDHYVVVVCTGIQKFGPTVLYEEPIFFNGRKPVIW